MTCRNGPPQGPAPEIVATQRTDQNKCTTEFEAWVTREQLEDELDQLRAETQCRRCSEPPPPLERWHGDPRARDYRPACTCGRQRAWSL